MIWLLVLTVVYGLGNQTLDRYTIVVPSESVCRELARQINDAEPLDYSAGRVVANCREGR